MRYKRERHAKPLGLIRQQHLEECLDHIGVISTPTDILVAVDGSKPACHDKEGDQGQS